MSDRQLGRPQDPAISEALVRVAERVMETEGYTRLSVEALCAEIGSTRPAFYRRYPNLAYLAFDVIRHRFGAEPPTETGTLDGDLLALQRAEVAMFADPLLHKSLPGLLESVRTDPAIAEVYATQFIVPRRARVGRLLADAVGRGEIPATGDVPFLCDMLVGPILARALLPGTGDLDDDLATSTAHAVLATLRAPVGAASSTAG